MKYCKQCGLLMADDATTCPSCGAAFVSENPLSMPGEVPAAPDASPYTQPEPQPAPDQAQYATVGAAPQDPGTAGDYGYAANPAGAPYQGDAPQSGPIPQGGTTYYNQPRHGMVSAQDEPLSMGGYLFTLVVFMIPLIGFIMQLVWSFGGSDSLARQNLSRAYLIRTLILFGIGVLFTIGFIAMMVAVGSSLSSYYY